MIKRCILIVLAFCLASCSNSLMYRDRYVAAFHEGDFQYSVTTLDQTIAKKIPNGNYRKCNDSVWLLLDRATTHFAMGDIKAAIQDYDNAINAIDYYTQDSTADVIGQILIQDEAGAYPGEDYEQILARVYFALALLQDGDETNAFALLRQAEEVQQKKREIYSRTGFTRDYHLIDNTLAKYLLGVISEKRGDYSNADILYQQTLELLDKPDSPAVPMHPAKGATVLVICHNGNAPYKISGTSLASVASAAAVEFIIANSGSRLDPAWSSLTGIPIPILCQRYLSDPTPLYARVDGTEKQLETIFDVTATAFDQLEQKKPLIVARGVARLLMRRATVGYFQQQDQTLGAVADIAVLIANANTKADTRSWSTLPSSIDIARYDLEPGEHEIAIHNFTPPLLRETAKIKLRSNDLCVINVFQIHPGVVTIQIPKRFLINHHLKEPLS